MRPSSISGAVVALAAVVALSMAPAAHAGFFDSLFGGGGGGGGGNDGSLRVLDDATFAGALTQGPHFVKFMAPWCGHCKKLAPDWEKLARELNTAESDVKTTVAKIDCTANRETCAKYKVTGYPTLKLISGDDVADYNGARSLDQLREFAGEDVKAAAEASRKAEAEAKAKAEEEAAAEKAARESSDVVWLTDRTIKSSTGSKTHLVKFYAPWCGHCKKLAPDWEKLATKFNKEERELGVTVAKVDCTVEKKACSLHGVKGFPTIKLLRGRHVADYNGAREFDALAAFAQTDIKEAARKSKDGKKKDGKGKDKDVDERELKRIADLEADRKARENSDISYLTDATFGDAVKEKRHLVKFYAPWCGHCKALAPDWEKLATKYNKDEPDAGASIAKVDCTVESATCQKYGVRGYPTIMMIDGEESAKYEGQRTLAALSEFATKDVAGAKKAAEEAEAARKRKAEEDAAAEKAAREASDAVWLTDDEFATATADRTHLVKFYAPWCGHCKKLAPDWDKLATKFNKEDTDAGVTIAKMDCTAEDSKKTCSAMGVRGFPTIKLVKGDKNAPYNGARTLEALTTFATKDVEAAAQEAADFDAKRKAQADSEAQALNDKDSAVVYLSADTFADAVAERPHFVKFFAPWCGHCKKLAPDWEKMAAKLKPKQARSATVPAIAKVDCTAEANRAVCQKYGVKSYPTLKLIHGEDVADYDGARTLEALMKFAAKDPKTIQREAAAKRQKAEDERRALEEERKNSDIVFLTDANYEEAIADKAHFVKFFAPWCGHCKKLAPTWSELATDFNKDDTSRGAVFAKVDCTADDTRAMCRKYGVKSFPTLKMIKGDQEVKYEGARSKEPLAAFAEKSIEDAAAEAERIAAEAKAKAEEEARKLAEERAKSDIVFLTDDNLDAEIADTVHFVKFFAPWCGHCKALAPTWSELATKYNKEQPGAGAKFAKVDCTSDGKKVCSKYGVKSFPTLKLVKGDKVVEYAGERDSYSLEEFATSTDFDKQARLLSEVVKEDPKKNKAAGPGRDADPNEMAKTQATDIVWLDDATFQDAVDARPHFIKFMAPWCGHCKKMFNDWAAFAKAINVERADEKLPVVSKIDCVGAGKETCEALDIHSFPMLHIMHGRKDVKYDPNREGLPRTVEAWTDFLEAYVRDQGNGAEL